jgi:hypothetical protein
MRDIGVNSVRTERCQHDPVPEMGYIAESEDAERRLARGERQMRCPECERYIWLRLYYKGQPLREGKG